MKDEEMAEQFADNISGLELTCSLLSAKDKNHAYRLGRYDGFLAGLKAGRPQWHKLSEKYPEADKLIRVRLMSGMEHICETCYYEPTEDEIGYGKLIINFYELDGEWVDDTEVIAWCEIPTFDKE
ncbi:MAG: hypothetical protein J6T31_05900 [Methanobrevibacter sp.]|nr:hypothetical protein [Methanobrevibacter sp.]